MPLINVTTKAKEQEFVFTNLEKAVLKDLPPEQVKAANHNQRLVEMMHDEELRDASPELTRRDIYQALRTRDIPRILADAMNLSIEEKNQLVKGLLVHLLSQKKGELSEDDARYITLMMDEPVDLFDLGVRLKEERSKRRKY